MIVLRNKVAVPLTARIQLSKEGDGTPVLWPRFDGSAAEYCDVVIQPNLSWAASFLPGNGFTAAEGASAGPPQNFQGHGTIACFQQTPFGNVDQTSNVLAFVLLANNAWKYGVNSPARKNSGIGGLLARQLWQFVYAIPYFDDRAGATAALWATGMSIQNMDTVPADLTLNYVIEQTYPQAGQTYLMKFSIPAGAGVRFDLLSGNPGRGVPGLVASGYPAGLNSEGHIDLSSTRPALLYPSLIIANSGYSFTVAEDFAE